MISLTGLWIKENEKSGKFFVGTLGGASIFIMKNKFKKTDKHPDYIMHIAENKKKEGSRPEPQKNDDDFGF